MEQKKHKGKVNAFPLEKRSIEEITKKSIKSTLNVARTPELMLLLEGSRIRMVNADLF